MPPVPDLNPDEIAAVRAARRRQPAVEDSLPPSLTARLDREVSARVEAELATRAAHQGSAGVQLMQKNDRSGDGRVISIVSLITGIPMLAIVEATSHGNMLGAAIVMGGIVLVNLSHALGRRRP